VASGANFSIRDGYTIGRGDKCQVRLEDPTASRTHACVRYARGAWFIQDLDSANGTWVNGQRVGATGLVSGDRIRIGDTEFEFRVG